MSHSCETIAITSGKGGVGKTLTTIHLAHQFSSSGKNVIVFDGDLGLSNVDVILGVRSRANISDVLYKGSCLEDVVVNTGFGFDLIPSGSGLFELKQMSHSERTILKQALYQMRSRYDVVIIDTGAGISEEVLHLCDLSDRVIVVTTPEPHAITDAYALIKVLSEVKNRREFNLLVNQVESALEGSQVASKIVDVSREFLDVDVRSLGSIPRDVELLEAVLSREVISEKTITTLSGQAWKRISSEFLPNDTHGSGRVWLDLLNHNEVTSPYASPGLI